MLSVFSNVSMVFSLLLFSSIAIADTPKPPIKKIIALSAHSVELLFLLGAGDRIVATTKFSDYPEVAKKIPRIGGYNGVQIEKVLELNPDLIIAWEGGNKAEDIDRMESLGFKVYRSETQSLSEISKELITLGRIIGLEDKAKQLALVFDSELTHLQASNARKPAVKFFYQLWSEPLRAMAAGSWINEVLASCGGENIFNDASVDYPQVSMENILLNAPAAIVIPSHHGAAIGEGGQWSAWPEIPAVKNKHIFYINGDLLHRFSFRILEGMKKVCSAFDVVREDRKI
jgi:vitamin B12 transport system substrate-binding protein